MSQIPTKQQIRENANDTDPIYENIQTIVELHTRAENEVSRQQRSIENITAFLGRPRFLFIILIFVSLWIMVNILLIKFGLPGFDPPPFTPLAPFKVSAPPGAPRGGPREAAGRRRGGARISRGRPLRTGRGRRASGRRRPP